MEECMQNFQYLIIGGGMTAAAAVNGIREVDKAGSIGILSAESHPPYQRPPLTKKLWQGKPEESIYNKFPKENVELILNCRVVSLDPARKQARDEAGSVFGYQKLLLATGGSPSRLPYGGENILYFRTLDDYHTVRGWTGKGARIGVIGGGFLGTELAASLAMTGEQVALVFRGPSIGASMYPADLSQYLNEYYRRKGVEIFPQSEIQAVERRGNRLVIQIKGGQEIEVDHIAASVGIRPNIELAASAGLKLRDEKSGGGVEVDQYLRTSQPDIFASGDLASFYQPLMQKRSRVEHEDNANTMGHTAGLTMAGQETAYTHQPYFYSDLFDLGYEAVGELDPHADITADWQERFQKGVLYYQQEGKIRGVLLWNTWDQVDGARKLIASGRVFQPSELKGRLPSEILPA
jgi:3-phenylpropionate/trans-cinnamate dioxygenase ferredoxin reductase component